MKRRRPRVVLSAAAVMAAAFPGASSTGKPSSAFSFLLVGQPQQPSPRSTTTAPAPPAAGRLCSKSEFSSRHGLCLRQAMSSSDLKQSRENGRNDPPDQENPTRQPPRKKRGRPRKDTKKVSPEQKKKQQKSSTPPKQTTTFSKDSVVHRLKQASLRAAAAEERRLRQEQQQQKEQSPSSFTRYNYNTATAGGAASSSEQQRRQRPMASLRDLTAAIDRQLQQARQGGASLLSGGGAVAGTASQQQQLWSARDSLGAVLAHNERQEQEQQQSSASVLPTSLLVSSRPTSSGAATTATVEKHVAIVLSKPLQNDQITVEYASRVQRLVRAIKFGESDDNNNNKSYQPDVIVFVGGRHPHAHLADCDAGYLYFRHLCAAQHVCLDRNIQFRLERSSVQEGALRRVAQYLQRNHLPQWVDEIKEEQQQQQQSDNNNNNNNNARGEKTTTKAVQASASSRNRRVKLLVRFVLFSSEYHLCILHDIHVRSPVNSPLAALDRWSLEDMESKSTKPSPSSSGTTTTTSSSSSSSSSTPYHQQGIISWLQLETSWTYQYATTPRIPTAHDPVRALAAACYRRAQSLIPVLENLRGVAQNHEFFQRDNYRVLVQARRSLVQDMEELYQRQPSLAAVHQQTTPLFRHDGASSSTNNNNNKPLDVVLEGALLSLGRCLDLVRPAGLLTGSVPAQDFVMAIALLEQTVSQISAACDPDRPLPASEWGRLPTTTTTTTNDDDDDDNGSDANAGSSSRTASDK